MNIQNVRRVMRKYGKAWETRDSNLLLECFAQDGTYQESPLAKPYRGYTEIKTFWNKVVVQKTRDIKFKLKKCYLSSDGKTEFAEWECKNRHGNKKHHMVGIFMLRMKGDKISYLNEYWNTEVKKIR